MVKKYFIERLVWSIILSLAVFVLLIFAGVNKNLNWANGALILIFALIDAYFIFMTIKFYKHWTYEKLALSKDMKATATYMDKKIAYRLGDFKKDLVTGVYKIQFSWVNELGEMIIDESLAVFTKEQAENLANRGSFNVFVAHEKKAVIIYNRI